MERNASGGYIALGKETTKGTAVATSLFTPYYSQSLITDQNIMSDEPVYGNKFKRFQSLPGVRSHGGTVQVMAEPNTAASWWDMLTTAGATSGAGPYTHPFAASAAADPNSYTVDVSLVSQVVRFIGVEASKIGVSWDDDKMVFDVDLSGLKSFYGREVAAVSGQDITLKTDTQFARPTEGLVVGDLLQIWDKSAQTYINCTVGTIASDTVVTVVGTITDVAADDFLTLRAATPSLSLLTPFLWAKTEYRFGVDAATALTATHTRLEPGTTMEIMHDFEDNAGAKRSGDFDPASLPRLQYDASFSSKIFLDDPEQFNEWNTLAKKAVVMRAFSGAANEYELRVTLNELVATTDETPTDSASVIYHEVEYSPSYSETDGQAFDVKVINNRATI